MLISKNCGIIISTNGGTMVLFLTITFLCALNLSAFGLMIYTVFCGIKALYSLIK